MYQLALICRNGISVYFSWIKNGEEGSYSLDCQVSMIMIPLKSASEMQTGCTLHFHYRVPTVIRITQASHSEILHLLATKRSPWKWIEIHRKWISSKFWAEIQIFRKLMKALTLKKYMYDHWHWIWKDFHSLCTGEAHKNTKRVD